MTHTHTHTHILYNYVAPIDIVRIKDPGINAKNKGS